MRDTLAIGRAPSIGAAVSRLARRVSPIFAQTARRSGRYVLLRLVNPRKRRTPYQLGLGEAVDLYLRRCYLTVKGKCLRSGLREIQP